MKNMKRLKPEASTLEEAFKEMLQIRSGKITVNFKRAWKPLNA
jgi:hypothetical protein